MTDKDLTDRLKALKIAAPIDRRRKAELRNIVLATPRQRSLKHAILEAFTIRRLVVNNQAKLVRTGMLSMAALAVVTSSAVGIYATQFSPKAYAMRSIDSAYQSVEKKSQEELAKIQASLGMNPNDALAEAKNSKNLREISQEEYDKIVASGKVRGNTLSSDPNAPIIGFTTNDPAAPSSEEAIPVNELGLDSSEYVIGATESSATGTNENEEKTVSSYDVSLPETAKYIRYTDANNNDVILSLDSENIPVFKTIVSL